MSGKGGRGEITASGLRFQFVRLNQFVYVRGGSAFWRRVEGDAAARRLDGKWLKASASSGRFAFLASLTSLRLILPSVPQHDRLAKGPTATVNGYKALAIKNMAGPGLAYVAMTGKPFLIETLITGLQPSHLIFGRYDEPVPLAVPANAIDVSKLGSN